MDDMKRLDIARQLANSFGMEGAPEKEPSSYDASTGTLFVGSRVYHTDDLERAKRFFRENRKKMHSLGDAASSLYEIGEIAVSRMIADSANEGGRVVIKSKNRV